MLLDLTQRLPMPVLALGAELKSTVCLAHGASAELTEPAVDLQDAASFAAFMASLDALPRAAGVTPAVIAHDLHPDYLSTKAARDNTVWPGVPRRAIQHHEAHVASCAASEGIWDSCIGLAFDGTGYGTDGTMWGGEFFVGSIVAGFKRVGRLRPMLLPGGPAAIREPWRLALALALEAGVDWPKPADVPDESWRVVHALAAQPTTLRSSSMGRLFDGVAALTGVCLRAGREAEAAIAIERAAGTTKAGLILPLPVTDIADGMFELDWRPLVTSLAANVLKSTISSLAAAFHDALSAAVAEACARIAGSGPGIAASGGVFLNQRFTASLRSLLSGRGLWLVTPSRVPCSDAGLSLGQAVLSSFDNRKS